MPSFCWEFNFGLLPAASLLSFLSSSSHALQPAPKCFSLQGESLGLASLPGLAPHCCLLANIQLPANVESALLLSTSFSSPHAVGFSLLLPQLFWLFPGWQSLPQLNLCFLQSSLVASLTSASLPRFFLSRANSELAAGAAAAKDNSTDGNGAALTQESDLGSNSASYRYRMQDA